MIEAVIFDWAGTTVDYGCFAPVQAFVESFAHFGIDVTMEETRKPMGMLKIEHIRTMLKMERIAKLWEEKYGHTADDKDVQAIYEQFEPKLLSILNRYSGPKPFVLDAVAKLRQMGLNRGLFLHLVSQGGSAADGGRAYLQPGAVPGLCREDAVLQAFP